MPIAVFDALKGNIRSFLGGAEVDLLPGDAEIVVDDKTISEIVTIEERPYRFIARRETLSFTTVRRTSAGSC